MKRDIRGLALILGAVLLGCEQKDPVTDDDGDGLAAEDDCDDSDAAVNPDAAEVCDGIDNDCDGSADEG